MLLPIRFKKVVVDFYGLDYSALDTETQLSSLDPKAEYIDVLIPLVYKMAETFDCEDIKNLVHEEGINTLGQLYKGIINKHTIYPSKSDMLLTMANTVMRNKQTDMALSFIGDMLVNNGKRWKWSSHEYLIHVDDGNSHILFCTYAADLVMLNTEAKCVKFTHFVDTQCETTLWTNIIEQFAEYQTQISESIKKRSKFFNEYEIVQCLATKEKVNLSEDLKAFAEANHLSVYCTEDFNSLESPTKPLTDETYNHVSGVLTEIDQYMHAPQVAVADIPVFDIKTLASSSLSKFIDSGERLKQLHPAAEDIMRMSLHCVLLTENTDLKHQWMELIQESFFSKDTDIEYIDFKTINNRSELITTLNTKGIICITNIRARKEPSLLNQESQTELLKGLAEELSKNTESLYVLMLPEDQWKQIQAIAPMLRVCLQYEFKVGHLEANHLLNEVDKLIKKESFNLSHDARKLAKEYLTFVCQNTPSSQVNFTIAQMLSNEILYYHRTSDHYKNIEIERSQVIEAIKDEYVTSEKRSLPLIMTELNKLVGLTKVKQNIKSMTAILKLAEVRAHTNTNISLNAIFMGNPGTGKTTVAHLLGEIYRSIGVLTRGQVICTTRSEIVDRWIGGTAKNMKELIDRARGGILLIDEAYALYRSDNDKDFGQEAIDTLVAELESMKDHTCVILAGYTQPMTKFLEANAGLSSRFPHKVIFEDYQQLELLEIIKGFMQKEQYLFSDEAWLSMQSVFKTILSHKDKHFGNARTCRNIFEQLKLLHANRLFDMESPSQEELNTITNEDVRLLQKQLDLKLVKPTGRIGYFSQRQ